jgi:cell shape-determining protein MreC
MDTRNRMEEALRQFESALAEVEETCSAFLADVGDAVALKRENDRLKDVIARLETRLQALQTHASELAEANRQALVRIDAAMERIRRVIGES